MAGGITGVGPHRFALRVYYEDTDLAGLVYYANYLKFIERARSEWVRDCGVDQTTLRAAGRVFAVRRLTADFLSPARFDDLLEVRTEVTGFSGARIHLHQEVCRDEKPLFRATVDLVCLTDQGLASRIPADIRQKLFPAQE